MYKEAKRKREKREEIIVFVQALRSKPEKVLLVINRLIVFGEEGLFYWFWCLR